MGPKTEELINVLDELASILEADGNPHWGDWMRKAQVLLLNSNYSGIEHLLSAYGGMGSLNDVVIGQGYTDGALTWKPGHMALNEKFASLSSRAYELANSIKQAQQ